MNKNKKHSFKSAKLFLENAPGYLKWGNARIAKLLGVSERLVMKVREEIISIPVKEVKLSKTKQYSKNKYNPCNVLVIGDPHEPFTKEGYLEHCIEIQDKYNCGTVVCIGDIIDNHYSSFHEQDPDGRSAGDELELTVQKTRLWHDAFPHAYCTIGNHDAIVMRKAFSSGVSKKWIKGLSDVLEMPTWNFVESIELYGVLYTHTLGANLLNSAMARRQSLVCGHLHTKVDIQWNANSSNRIFAMSVGCGIDDKAYAFSYAKLTPKKSFISCGVVLESGNIPIIIPMDL
jgi:hypothetical protein